MMTDLSQSIPKNPLIYICDVCGIETRNKKDFKRHLLTKKHRNNDISLQNNAEKSPNLPQKFTCECGKQYKYRQGLYVHKKKCNNCFTNPYSFS